MKNHGARQKATHVRRRSHKDTGRSSTKTTRGKKRHHSESSVKTQIELELTIPETIGSADEDDNNYFDLYNGTFDDDEVFVGSTSSQEHQETTLTQDCSNSSINLNELSSCLEKIQNVENGGTYDEVDYSNLFATVDVANDVDIDKLINSNDYEQDEFVPFEYVKKLIYEENTGTNNVNSDCHFNQSSAGLEQFSYGML